MNADGSQLEVFASGIRNTVGFDWHPVTGELWFTDNGRDNMGDDFPDCELNVVPTGARGPSGVGVQSAPNLGCRCKLTLVLASEGRLTKRPCLLDRSARQPACSLATRTVIRRDEGHLRSERWASAYH